ncbi:hypothetical protein DAPPUDRAFT_244160 [Daphnia pulex]|uniref:Uncharacterized protein n=1 Tax=Daphnia pulex TaxID=6669 RepID=E9GKC3_DAPPU|nr:hypothetical protein DAPPUDRAFT_244160 [Daphnia pulex]|eukprot:EFX79964.1 hypothetical protein DAPPUDRAFT_244160 [Daphnia pulex]
MSSSILPPSNLPDNQNLLRFPHLKDPNTTANTEEDEGLSSKSGSFSQFKIRPEQKRKRHEARMQEEIPLWTGPILPPIYRNTRAGRIEEYHNRPIVPCAVDSDDPVIPAPTPEQREINHRRVLERIASYDPPPRRYFPSPAEIEEFNRLRTRPNADYRITTGRLFNSPRRQQLHQGVEAIPREEDGAVGGGENKVIGGGEKEEEGAVGGGESEEEEALQVLYEDISIEEPAPAPISLAPQPAEPPRQGRSRGRGVLMYSRERSTSRIGWIRKLAQQQENN